MRLERKRTSVLLGDGVSLRELTREAERILDGLPALPDPFTPEAFAEVIAHRRGRPIIMRELDPFGPDLPCGLWVSLADRDIVCYASEADPFLQDHIKMHELAHILRGDERELDAATLKRMLPSLSPALIARLVEARRVLGRTGYGPNEEKGAEMLARVAAERAREAARSDHFLRSLADAPPPRPRRFPWGRR